MAVNKESEIFSNMDLRGYINELTPGALTEGGQRDKMPKGTELYIEDRKGHQIESLIASIRKGSIVPVVEMYYLAPAAFRAPKRRRVLGERIEAIRERGGVIWELSTDLRSNKRLSAMLLRAYEQIASSGRKRKGPKRGAPIKWNLTPEERMAVESIWQNPRYANDLERVGAIHEKTGKKMSRAWLRRHFGSPFGPVPLSYAG